MKIGKEYRTSDVRDEGVKERVDGERRKIHYKEGEGKGESQWKKIMKRQAREELKERGKGIIIITERARRQGKNDTTEESGMRRGIAG